MSPYLLAKKVLFRQIKEVTNCRKRYLRPDSFCLRLFAKNRNDMLLSRCSYKKRNSGYYLI